MPDIFQIILPPGEIWSPTKQNEQDRVSILIKGLQNWKSSSNIKMIANEYFT